MKFLQNSAVLLTAASSASAAATGFFTPQDQQVIGKVADVVDTVKETVFDGLSSPLDKLRASYASLEGDVRAAWDEVATMFPEDMNLENFMTRNKKASRKPDSEWDHIVRGKDVQSVWIENAQGQKERELDGKLENFNLRVKAVDPEKLGVDPGVKQYSGYIDDEEEDKHLFYWFFESRNDPKNDPVVLWLNGGPGCSSLTGLFFELGPSSINSKAEPVFNPHSWNANASVIFLDQPVNVGYSYSSGGVSNTVAAAKDVYAFLTLWFKQFPEYAKQDFHIAGESYAGHYIPVFASEILAHKNRNINLKSILIGNGLTDGLTQQAYYEPFACGQGGWPAVLDESECQSMRNALPRCESLVQSCYDSESIWTCVPAAIYCNNAMIGPYQRSGQNPYDIRKPCGSNPLCYDGLGDIETFLNKPSVMKALGVEVSEYTGCNNNINRNFLFQGDWMKPYHRLVPDLIKQIPVLIYAGDADFICNWMGNHAWTEALEWHGQKKFNDQKLKKFQHSSKGFDIGLQKAHGNFSFMTVHAAGHMVPYDKPEGALDMLNRWISGEWFDL